MSCLRSLVANYKLRSYNNGPVLICQMSPNISYLMYWLSYFTCDLLPPIYRISLFISCHLTTFIDSSMYACMIICLLPSKDICQLSFFCHLSFLPVFSFVTIKLHPLSTFLYKLRTCYLL